MENNKQVLLVAGDMTEAEGTDAPRLLVFTLLPWGAGSEDEIILQIKIEGDSFPFIVSARKGWENRLYYSYVNYQSLDSLCSSGEIELHSSLGKEVSKAFQEALDLLATGRSLPSLLPTLPHTGGCLTVVSYPHGGGSYIFTGKGISPSFTLRMVPEGNSIHDTYFPVFTDGKMEKRAYALTKEDLDTLQVQEVFDDGRIWRPGEKKYEEHVPFFLSTLYSLLSE